MEKHIKLIFSGSHMLDSDPEKKQGNEELPLLIVCN